MFIDIDIGPKDPRFIGAWWLGFVILGFASMLIALPVMCFPRTLKPQHAKKEYGHIPGQKSSSFSKELKGKLNIYVPLNGPVKLSNLARLLRTVDMPENHCTQNAQRSRVACSQRGHKIYCFGLL